MKEIIQGWGQGFSPAGTVWSLTDYSITKSYNEVAKPAIITDPITAEVKKKTSSTYVEDRNLYTSGANNE